MGKAWGALAGVRILDLGWMMAGPQATSVLAAYGADVLKVESRARPDWARTTFGPIIADDPYDGSAYFHNFNRNKRSITLNMATEAGRALFARLLGISDGVLENFSAGVLTKWGFSYEQMARIRPDIVYVSMSGFGHSGPYSGYQSFGPTVQAASGLTHQSGFPDKAPAGWGFSYMDHTGGYYGAIAMLQALLHRRRTGRGQHVDLSQVEAAITLTGTAILDKSVNGRASTRAGNLSGEPPLSPHGVYRCAPDPDPRVGGDAWVAIAVETSDQWRALCRVLGDDALAADPELQSVGGRQTQATGIDAVIEAWTRQRDPWQVMDELQAAGVPAGAVQRSRDLAERDPQIRHRGMRPKSTHALLGTLTVDGVPVGFSRTPAAIKRPGPMLGEANTEVFGEVLGLCDDEIERLIEQRVLW
ncbi:MAG: CoA transferase [Chloroflexi bacterium]|nr:CoA transferase [Chloroflexota bacterium]